MYIKRTLTAITLSLSLLSTSALSEEDHHEEEHHSHAMHEWELGVSIGYANLKTENEEGGNLHLHLMKRLEGDGFEKYFSVGLGAEMIVTTDYAFDVSENYHIGPVIGYSKTSDTEHYTVGIHIGIPL